MAGSTNTPLRFGNYEVLHNETGGPLLLGEGAFGKTYKARHVFLNKETALKVIRPEPEAFERARQQFLKEARAAAELSHPHIAAILDFGEADGYLYYAMEFCAGGDLHRYIDKHGPLPVEEAVELFQQSADALRCAHHRGFLHRDLKPSNLLLAAETKPLSVKLIDFGLVKEVAGALTPHPGETQGPVTETAHFAGTPLFASPEQLREELLDARSDLFSLGMTWWFLLTGKPPFNGPTAAVVADRLKAGSYGDQLPGALPADLRELISDMIEKERDLRPASVDEVLKRLEEMTALDSSTIVRAGRAKRLDWTTYDRTLLSMFSIEGESDRCLAGSFTAAMHAEDGSLVWLLIFDDPAVTLPEKRAEIVTNANALRKMQNRSVLQLLELVRATDGYAAVFGRDQGVALLDVLKALGSLSFTQALPLLKRLAAALDALRMVGLPTPGLAPHQIQVDHRLLDGDFAIPDFLIQIRPELIDVSPTESGFSDLAGATMMVGMSQKGLPAQAFAGLVYRLVAGRALPTAASITREAYISVSALSEDGNRILAETVSEPSPDQTCTGLIERLSDAEGAATSAKAPIAQRLSDLSRQQTRPNTGQTFATIQAGGSVQLRQVAQSQTRTRGPATQSSPRKANRVSTPSSTPSKSGTHLIPLFLGALVLLGLGLVGFGLLTGSKKEDLGPRPNGLGSISSPENPAPTPTPAPTPPVRTAAPDYFTLSGGIIPSTVTIRVNDLPVTPEITTDSVKIPLKSAGYLPLRIGIEAVGYRPKIIEVKEGDAFTQSDLIRLPRATGVVAFEVSEAMDYAEATFKMIEPLPSEPGVRPEATPFTFPLLTGAASRELPTGVYEVILRGRDPARVQPLKLKELLSITSESPAKVAVPVSITGSYQGTDPNGNRVTLSVDADLRGGTLAGDRFPVSLSLSDLRLNNAGILAAQSSPMPDGQIWQVELGPPTDPRLVISPAMTPAGIVPPPPVTIVLTRVP